MVVKRILVVVLSVLLCVSLFGANAAIALDRGALNADYVKGAAAEHGLYEAVHDEAIDTIGQEIPDSEGLPVDIDLRAVVENALTAEYVQNQSEQNIDRVHAFLRGEGELEIVLDTVPLKQNIVDALVEEVKRTDVAELAGGAEADRLSNLTESEESYEAERESFREEIKAEIQSGTGMDPDDDFGSDVLANLSESEESYEAEREAFEEDRKREIQNSTHREMTDEELERAYQDNLPEIRDELRSALEARYVTEDTPESLEPPITDLIDLTVDALTTDLSYDEFLTEYDETKESIDEGLDELIEERSDEFADEFRDELEAEMAASDLPPPFEEGLRATVDLVIEAYTTDLTYEEFTSELESIQVTMAEAGGEYILNEHEGGVPDRIELTEEMDESDREDLEPIRRAVSTIGLLALLLPLLSLGLIGGMYGVTRREDTVALAVGAVALIVGALSAGVARAVPAEAMALLEPDVSESLAASIEGMVGALFDPLWVQSLVLIAGGVALVAVGIAVRYDLGPFGGVDDE